jgi:hypothetical protein
MASSFAPLVGTRGFGMTPFQKNHIETEALRKQEFPAAGISPQPRQLLLGVARPSDHAQKNLFQR